MDDKKIEEYEERLKNRHVERNYNFFKPVGQFIEYVDTINFSMDKDGTFHFENIGQVNGPESQNLTKGTVPVVREVDKESPQDDEKEDGMASVAKCFKFPNEFLKHKVKAIVNDYYHGIAANLALIEVTLFDHNQLKKRNAHTALLKSLIAWDIIEQLSDEDFKKTTNGMANKLGFMPSVGYMEWDGQNYVNDKKTCMDIGKDLGPTIPYSREKEK